MDPKDIEICKRPDGEPWLLGSGAYGQVRAFPLVFTNCNLLQRWLPDRSCVQALVPAAVPSMRAKRELITCAGVQLSAAGGGDTVKGVTDLLKCGLAKVNSLA